MRDVSGSLQKRAIKYGVMTLAVVNCVGIYVAHDRLNRPYSGTATPNAQAVIDFAATSPAQPALAPSIATDSAVRLGIEAGPPAEALAIKSDLPELAALPPLKVEAAPVVPSVRVRAARLGSGEARPARVRQVRQPEAERSFDAAFTPDYAALAPYNGAAEASGLSSTVQEATAMGESEVASEVMAIETGAISSPASSAGPFVTPVIDSPAPAELPAVDAPATATAGTPG